MPELSKGTPAAGQPSMFSMARLFSVGAVMAIAVSVAATAAQAQIPARVRVLTESEQIMRWLGPQRDVIYTVGRGTTLDVLDFDREANSYWVILPPDLHGTRKVGWIRATSVEPHVASPASEVRASAARTP